MNAKIAWSGAVTAVQPRIRATRSFDERSHTYLGYLLRIEGTVGGVSAEFRVGIGSGTHAKHQLRIGDHVEGVGHRVTDPRLETADIYKVSTLKLMRRGEELAATAPWHAVPPPLTVYRERGHRRLAVTTYDSKCKSCVWGCAMPVEMIIDHWNPDRRRYRTETFYCGPLSCSRYKPGPTRKVPGRHGMTCEEETGSTRTAPRIEVQMNSSDGADQRVASARPPFKGQIAIRQRHAGSGGMTPDGRRAMIVAQLCDTRDGRKHDAFGLPQRRKR